MALSWSGETAELKSLIDYSRRFRIGLIAMTADRRQHARQGRRRGAGAAAGARGLPAQSRADHVLADAACARRRAGDRAAGKPRLHRDRFRHAASRRPARRACSNSCATSCTAATRCRSPARHARCRTRWWRCRPRASAASASPIAHGMLVGIITDGDLRRHMRPDLLDATVDEVMTRDPEDRARRSARQRGARSSQFVEDHRAVRRRRTQAGRHRAHARSAAHRRGVICPGCGAAWSGAERCTADPGPFQIQNS